jgi:hypothetical protein
MMGSPQIEGQQGCACVGEGLEEFGPAAAAMPHDSLVPVSVSTPAGNQRQQPLVAALRVRRWRDRPIGSSGALCVKGHTRREWLVLRKAVSRFVRAPSVLAALLLKMPSVRSTVAVNRKCRTLNNCYEK